MYLLQPDPNQPYPIQPYTPQPYYPVPPTQGFWDHILTTLQQSVYNVLALLIRILPFVVTLAVMVGLGILLSWLVRKVLTSARFDERIARTQAGNLTDNGIADWSPDHSPTALVGRIIFWSFVLLGLATGVSAFDPSYSSSMLTPSLLPYLTRSVGSILLLFAGNLVARFLARTVLIGAVNNQLQYARFLAMGVKWLVLVLTGAMVLDHLQIGGAIVELAFGILFGGIVLTLALAIGLGSRDLVSRSLERSAGIVPDSAEPSLTTSPPPIHEPVETLRHF